MNYNHLYHAGNFADIVKHTVLIALIHALQKKETPCCIIDTHAGAGDYGLQTREAQINKEFQNGVVPCMQHVAQHPAMIQLQHILREYNPTGIITRYPGSPYVSARLLRPQDSLILIEKHPDFFKMLKTSMRVMRFSPHHGQGKIALHQRDAYEALGALLPPATRRGLVLIDPPYENKDESECVVAGLEKALKRWPQAIYAVWYPIKMHRTQKPIMRESIETANIEITIFSEHDHKHKNEQKNAGLIGCGVVIVNPPWQFKEVLERLRQELEIAFKCTI